MSIQKKHMSVLREWYRMSTLPQVAALPHPAFRWLEGVTMNWSGKNNGAIEFTKSRHGALYGLNHTEVFDKARDDVIGARLVWITRQGRGGRAHLYALSLYKLQVDPRHWATKSKFIELGSSGDLIQAENLRSSDVLIELNPGSSGDPI